jgi:hypothetical protein
LKREEGKQNLGFSSRPFVLCGLPVRKSAQGQMLYERRNGNFVLQITGHPDYGLPFGQDRVVPIYLATLAVRQQSAGRRFEFHWPRKERRPLRRARRLAWWIERVVMLRTPINQWLQFKHLTRFQTQSDENARSVSHHWD